MAKFRQLMAKVPQIKPKRRWVGRYDYTARTARTESRTPVSRSYPGYKAKLVGSGRVCLGQCKFVKSPYLVRHPIGDRGSVMRPTWLLFLPHHHLDCPPHSFPFLRSPVPGFALENWMGMSSWQSAYGFWEWNGTRWRWHSTMDTESVLRQQSIIYLADKRSDARETRGAAEGQDPATP
jgi:hypothetical protein